MNVIVHHVWLVGVGLAVAGTILILLGGRCLAAFASWLQRRGGLRSERAITWEDAIGQCKAGPGVFVVESGSRPGRVWFLKGKDEAAFFSRKESPRSKGLLVINPPADANRMSEDVEKVGGRIIEIDVNGTFW